MEDPTDTIHDVASTIASRVDILLRLLDDVDNDVRIMRELGNLRGEFGSMDAVSFQIYELLRSTNDLTALTQ